MTLNARTDPAADDALVGWLPGAVGRRSAAELTLQLTVVLLAAAVLLDHLVRHPHRRRQLVLAVALSGAAVTVFGVADRLGWGPLRYHDVPFGGYHFAAFRAHANAAAYLNLCLPAGLALTAEGLRHRQRATIRVGLATSATILIGCMLHASKFGQLLTGVILLVGGYLVARQVRSVSRRRFVRRSVIGVAVAVTALSMLLTAGRWRAVPELVSADNGRVLVWRVTAGVWADHPWFGVGPGGLKLVLPQEATERVPELYANWVVTPYLDGAPVNPYQYANADPLQALAEWGLVGTALLVAVLTWPIVNARERWRRAPDRPTVGCALIALAAVGLHSLVDFPLHVTSIELTAAVWLVLLAALPARPGGPP